MWNGQQSIEESKRVWDNGGMAQGPKKRKADFRGDSLGVLIRRQREAIGMSQRQLAIRANMSPGAINRIESGDIDQPSPKRLAVLADVLGVGLSEAYAAASQRDEREVLPAMTPYLRKEYADMPPEAHRDIERYFARVQKKYGVATSGPADGEDEAD